MIGNWEELNPESWWTPSPPVVGLSIARGYKRFLQLYSYTPCMDNSGRMGQPPAEQAGGGEGESWTRSSNARPARMRRWKLVDSFGIESGGGTSLFKFQHPLTSKLVGNTPHQTGGFQILRSGRVKARGLDGLSGEEAQIEWGRRNPKNGRSSTKTDPESQSRSEEGRWKREERRRCSGGGASDRKSMRRDDMRLPSSPQDENHTGRFLGACSWRCSAHFTDWKPLDLWMAIITRWVLKSKGPFATFLHSYVVSNKPFEKKGTTDCLWPVPAPYPRWLGVSRGVGGRQRAVNLAVLALSWLHMGCPASCPSQLWRGKTLSSKQRAVVDHLEEHYKDVQIGTVGPTEMGRICSPSGRFVWFFGFTAWRSGEAFAPFVPREICPIVRERYQ